MLRVKFGRVAGALDGLSRIFADLATLSDETVDPANPHVVHVRDAETAVDVRTLDGVTWDEDAKQYKVEYKVPPMKHAAIDGNPMVRSRLNVERRGDGMYLTQHTDNAETAHAISRFMTLLWEDDTD